MLLRHIPIIFPSYPLYAAWMGHFDLLPLRLATTIDAPLDVPWRMAGCATFTYSDGDSHHSHISLPEGMPA